MKWFEEDIKELKQYCDEGYSDKDIAIRIGRTEGAVRIARYRLNIETDKDRCIDAANVICPYFIKYGKCKVICEGFNNSSYLTTVFEDAQRQADFAQKFCQNREWEQCAIANTISKLWE